MKSVTLVVSEHDGSKLKSLSFSAIAAARRVKVSSTLLGLGGPPERFYEPSYSSLLSFTSLNPNEKDFGKASKLIRDHDLKYLAVAKYVLLS